MKLMNLWILLNLSIAPLHLSNLAFGSEVGPELSWSRSYEDVTGGKVYDHIAYYRSIKANPESDSIPLFGLLGIDCRTGRSVLDFTLPTSSELQFSNLAINHGVVFSGNFDYLFAFELKSQTILWKTKMPELDWFGWSAPILADKLVVYPKHSQNDSENGLVALDQKTGEIKWTYFFAPKDFQVAPPIYDTVRNQLILFTYKYSQEKGLIVLDAKNGKFLYNLPTKNHSLEDPLIVGDLLIAKANPIHGAPDSEIFDDILAIRLDTHEIAWQLSTHLHSLFQGTSIYTRLTTDGESLYFVLNDYLTYGNQGRKDLLKVRIEDQALIWKVKLDQSPDPTLSIKNGKLLFSDWRNTTFEEGKSRLYRVDTLTGKMDWDFRFGHTVSTSSLVCDDWWILYSLESNDQNYSFGMFYGFK